MASEVEQKLDTIIELLRVTVPDPLPPGIYKARILDIDERVSHHSGRTYWVYKCELGIVPGRYVWGNFMKKNRPALQEVGAECWIDVDITKWEERRYNSIRSVDFRA